MACNERLRVQAYFDGETDASAAADIERHLQACRECAELLASLDSVSGALREAPYHRAHAKLRSHVMKALDHERGHSWALGGLFPRGAQFWPGAASGAAATMFAAALAFFVLVPPTSTHLVNDVMSAHLRSLMAEHLIDVASSDQHTVKPWFAGHADVSPPTADFPKEDFRLVGGRVDYVEGHRAAVLVYRHGAHTINVFTWAQSGEALPGVVTRNGYHSVFWQSGDLVFCAVSDTALDELMALVRLLKEI